jgi:hypothetical protein
LFGGFSDFATADAKFKNRPSVRLFGRLSDFTLAGVKFKNRPFGEVVRQSGNRGRESPQEIVTSTLARRVLKREWEVTKYGLFATPVSLKG